MSTIQKYNTLFKNLGEKGPDKNILLLYGEEDYLKKVAISRVESYSGTKRVSFFGRDTDTETVISELMNTGLFQNNKLVVVYEFCRLKNREKLLTLSLSQGTYLLCVLSSSCDKKKQRNILQKVKKLKGVQTIEFNTLDLNGFKAWVKQRFKRREVLFDEKDFEILIKNLPQNLTQAEKELEKLFLFMGEEKVFSIEYLPILSRVSNLSLSTTLQESMGYEKKHLKKLYMSIMTAKPNETLYEMETHFARIIDARLDTFFSDRYRSKWKIIPYKRHKMLHTLKDAAIVLNRLLDIELATKTSLHNEKITKGLILLSMLP